MKYTQINPSFFSDNRNKLLDQLLDNSLLILFSSEEYPRNGDQFFPFRQNSDLYYLTGIDQEKTALLIWKGTLEDEIRIMLFIKKTDKNQEIWFGKKLNLRQASIISDIEKVKYMEELDDWIGFFSSRSDNFYSWQPDLAKFDNSVLSNSQNMNILTKDELINLNQINLFDLTSKLRMIKNDVEIETMKKAIKITRDAYFRVLKNIKPGMTEYEIEAEITYEFIKQGANGHAYNPIIAGGENACILHYPNNDKSLNNGELLLMDFGAEYGNYAADCTRTIPINGIFSERQKDCYKAVLEVYNRAIQLFVPGNTIDQINIKVGLWLQEKMVLLGLLTTDEIENHTGDNPAYYKYFMHGTSHFIGLDVHDVGTKQTPFEKGMVLTCEPGLYIAEENIGIRIETNIFVDEVPIDLMADFPVEIDEIESVMRKKE